MHHQIIDYSIRDIIDYRELSWPESEEFLFLTKVPDKYEPFSVNPTYYCFGMITQGNLEIEIDKQYYKLSPNSLMIYRPGQVFKVISVSEDTKCALVLFTRKFIDELNENIFSVQSHSFLSHGIKTVIELIDNDRDKILGTFKEIFALLQHLSKPHWELIARNLTSALVYETDTLLRDYIGSAKVAVNKENELFIRFKNLVANHFKESRQLAFYASKLCVSTNYLYVLVKKISGHYPTQLISNQVISEAKYQICQTAGNFSEIAYLLNFSDPFAFSKFFKKHTGYSPSQFRKQAATMELIEEFDM
ncbi:AraC family transcriptional regulator [Pedobacter sp. L105]|uniref:helix-turn-helix domain-containing protein n=1 Tax=Pedobacter sp. L105 TaxID=1641871 RepID=UPI00131C9D29|nr:AraC family transcriptional regulator [Pedobacter sp. L105]